MAIFGRMSAARKRENVPTLEETSTHIRPVLLAAAKNHCRGPYGYGLEPQDLTQHALFAVVQAWPKRPTENSPEGFAVTVGLNAMISAIRKQRAAKRGGGGRATCQLDGDIEVADDVEKVDLRMDLSDIISRFTPFEQSIIRQLQHSEIASIVRDLRLNRSLARKLVRHMARALSEQGYEKTKRTRRPKLASFASFKNERNFSNER